MLANKSVYKNEQSKLVIYPQGKDNQPILAYVVSFFVDTTDAANPARPFFIVDAKTKSILKEWNGLAHQKIGMGPGGNEKMGFYVYGNEFSRLDVSKSDETCSMDNERVRTIDLGGTYGGLEDPFSFDCYWHSGDDINGAYSPLNDAHYFGDVIFDMYGSWYNSSPLTFKLQMRVHYGAYYENAFWDGSAMTFGDGFSYFYPLVCLDVAAHEISHGFTEQNSGLEYWGQSGGMNEAFSDIAGKAAEYFSRSNNTWGVGDDITKGPNPLRFMDDPPKDGISIGDARDYTDWLDVHYSSGVYNKAFYLLATADGWDTHKAFDVMVQANRYHWISTTNFAEGAEGAVKSAAELGYSVDDVVAAFAGVGIDCDAEDATCVIADCPDDPGKSV